MSEEYVIRTAYDTSKHASLPGAIGDPAPVGVAWEHCVDEPWIISTVTFDDGDSKSPAQEISFEHPDCLLTDTWDKLISRR